MIFLLCILLILILILLLLLRLFALPQSRTYTPPPGLTTQMPVGQMSVGGATIFGPDQNFCTVGKYAT